MNTAEARKRGYEIIRGSYAGTQEDNKDYWYIVEIGEITKKWYGYRTRKQALDTLETRLESEASYID
jgi:hypothetical protein